MKIRLLLAASLLFPLQVSTRPPGATGAGEFTGGAITDPLDAPSGCTTIPYRFASPLNNYGMCYDPGGGTAAVQLTVDSGAGAKMAGLQVVSRLLNDSARSPEVVVGVSGAYGGVQTQWVRASEFKIITESSATPFLVISYPDFSGGPTGGRLGYCAFAFENPAYQTRCGSFQYAIVKDATAGATPTCVMSPAAPDNTNDGSAMAGGGTLTYAITVAATANTCTFSMNAVSSLAQSFIAVAYQPLITNISMPDIATP